MKVRIARRDSSLAKVRRMRRCGPGAVAVVALLACSSAPRAKVRVGHRGAPADRRSAFVLGSPSPSHSSSRVIGTSVRGRPIRVRVVGDPASPRAVLVVGCIHGDETAGEAVTRRLAASAPRRGVSLWLVQTFNPDGCAAYTRQNARGVDLNRNSPWRWRPLDHPGGTFYSGPGPLSEPESRAINRLVRRLRPAVSVWYHQHAGLVDDSGGDRRVEQRYARLVGLPFRHFGSFPGSITSWQDATYPGSTAFVVELPAGSLSPSAVGRHARAVLALAERP